MSDWHTVPVPYCILSTRTLNAWSGSRLTLMLLSALLGRMAFPSAAWAQANPLDAFGPHSYICNYATVVGQERQAAPVYDAHGSQKKVILRLKKDTPIYICDEAPGWYGIRLGGTCAQTFPNGLKVEVARECKAGWMRRKDVIVRSG